MIGPDKELVLAEAEGLGSAVPASQLRCHLQGHEAVLPAAGIVGRPEDREGVPDVVHDKVPVGVHDAEPAGHQAG